METMGELNVNQIPSLSAFGSLSCNVYELLSCSNGGNVSHDVDLIPWQLDYSQKTAHYGEAAQYLAGSGSCSVPEMQAIPTSSDFHWNQDAAMESTSMDKYEGSFVTNILDVDTLDGRQYQDLFRTTVCGQYMKAENEDQPNYLVDDLEEATAVPCVENLSFAQNHSSRTEEGNGNSSKFIEPYLEPSNANSEGSKKRSREKLRMLDCERRLRITKHIRALEELLPKHSRGQVEVLDDSIAYVKHLQHQLKELSQTRLGCETNTNPLISLEEFGLHLPQLSLKQHCEDIFGQLLQENPEAALKLLEGRGLVVVPAALADGLRLKE